MSPFRSIPLILVLLIPLLGQSQNTDKSGYELLWKVSHDSLEQESYLFGTIHLRDKRAFEFPDSLMDRFLACDGFAMEIHLDTMWRNILETRMREVSTEYWQDELSEDELVYYAEQAEDLGLEKTDVKGSWNSLRFLLRNVERNKAPKMPVYLDAWLFYQARSAGMEIYGLEGYEEHNRALRELDASARRRYRRTLFGRLQDFDRYMSKRLEILKIYQRGDIAAIDSITRTDSVDDSFVIDFRNEIMAESLADLMREGKSVFAAVGSAHLAGEKGMIQLMEDKGFRMTLVPAAFTGQSDPFLEKEIRKQWYPLESEEWGYRIEFPNPPLRSPGLLGLGDAYGSFNMMPGPEYTLLTNVTFLDLAEVEEDMDARIEEVVRDLGGRKSWIKKDTVEMPGVQGLLYKIVRPFSKKEAMRMLVILGDRRMVLLSAEQDGKESFSNEIDSVFSSLELFAPKLKEPDIEPYVDEKHAYQVALPGTPVKQRVPVDEYDPSYGFMDLNLAVDSKTGVTYLVQCVRAGVDEYYSPDSATFAMSFGAILEEEEFDLSDERIREIPMVGATAYECLEPVKDIGGKLLFASVIRDNRMFVLGVSYPNKTENPGQIASDFFRSFQPLPYKPDSLQRIQTNGWSSLLADSSKSPDYGYYGYNYYNMYEVKSSYFQDSITSGSGAVDYYVMNPYYTLDTAEHDFLLDFAVSEIIDQFEPVDTLRGELPDGSKWLELATEAPVYHHKRNTRVISKDNRMLIASHTTHTSKQVQDRARIFLDSLRFEEDTVNEIIADFHWFSDKAELLIESLLDSDTAVRVPARTAIRKYPFRPRHAEMLLEAFQSESLTDDSLGYASSRAVLLRELQILDTLDDAVVEAIINVYPKIALNSHVGAYCYALYTRIPFEDFMQHLDTIPLEELGASSVSNWLDTLRWDRELLDRYMPQLLRMGETNIGWASGVLQLMSKSPLIVQDDLAMGMPLRDFTDRWMPPAVDSFLEHKGNWASSWYAAQNLLQSGMLLYTKAGDPKLDKLVKSYEVLGDTNMLYPIEVYKAFRGKKYDEDLLADMLNSGWDSFDFVQYCHRTGRAKELLGERHGSAKAYSRYYLQDYLVYEYGLLTGMNLVDAQVVDYDGEGRVAYVYLINYVDYPDEPDYYLVLKPKSREGQFDQESVIVQGHWALDQEELAGASHKEYARALYEYFEENY